MTTPPQIEAIARAIDPEAFSSWQRMYDLWAETWTGEDAKRIADRQYGASIQTAIDHATLAFSMSAEICAKVVDEFEGSSYPSKAAAAIRALAVEG